MSIGRTLAVALTGLEGSVVTVEADITAGLPHFAVSGLPDAACAQAPDRIKAATAHSGVPLPQRRITVNLSPASLPKSGAGFDLPMAIAALAATGEVPADLAAGVAHIGELGLDGSVRPVRGVLPAVLAAAQCGVRDMVVPLGNAGEARLVPGVRVHPVADLGELIRRYAAGRRAGQLAQTAVPEAAAPAEASPPAPDLADVVGQPSARLALELAAAGGHHVFLVGPPGAGKTMLAERLVGILPPLTPERALEALAIRSLLGQLGQGCVLDPTPPFVAPHHSATPAAMVGGGSGAIRPGAISQAHHGVLFLDEAPEFRTGVLQSLRQPLESGEVVVARARSAVRYPARFQLVMAANPCPCGLGFGKGSDCSCSPLQRRSYLGRIAGPLLDRVDLQLRVGPVTRASLGQPEGESSARVAARVAQARGVQAERWGPGGWSLNGLVPGPVLRRGRWRLPGSVTAEVDRALDRGQLTLRGYDRVLRLGWTSADLEGRPTPGRDDLGLALSLRNQGPVAA